MKKVIYKFAHAADLHCGVKPKNNKTRKIDVLETYLSMCRSMTEAQVDTVIFAGDVFHTKVVDFETLSYVRYGFDIIKNNKIKLYTITGNHDDVPEYRWPTYFGIPNPETGIFYDKKIIVHGINWNSIKGIKSQLTDEYLSNINRNYFNILVVHQGVEGHLHGNENDDSVLSLEYIKYLSEFFNYIALGHIHHNYSHYNAHNPGSIEYLSVSEWGHKTGYNLVTVYEDLSYSVELVETKKRPNLKISIKVKKGIDKREICGIIDNRVKNKNMMLYIEFDSSLRPTLIKEVETYIIETFDPVSLKIKTTAGPLPQTKNYNRDKGLAQVYSETFGPLTEQAQSIAQVYKEPDKVIEIVDSKT